MNRTSGVVAAAALLSGAAVWLWRRSASASNDRVGQAPLSRWEGEGGSPAAAATGASTRRNKRQPAEPSNSDAVGSTPDAWVYPRA